MPHLNLESTYTLLNLPLSQLVKLVLAYHIHNFGGLRILHNINHLVGCRRGPIDWSLRVIHEIILHGSALETHNIIF